MISETRLTFEPAAGAVYDYDYSKIVAEINSLAASGDEKRLIQFMRFWCQESLFFIAYFVLRIPVNHPFLVERIKEVQAQNDRTLDLWSREFFKSSIITYALNVQNILVDPDVRIGIFSHTRNIAKAFLRRIKITLESNDVLKTLFPDILYENPSSQSPKWSEDEGLIVRRSSVFQECTVEAWGLTDGQPTSKHFPVLNYDDVVTVESVSTPAQIKKTSDCFRLSMNLGTDGGKKRVIGTIYHYADLHMELEQQGGWIVRKRPAEDAHGNPTFLSAEKLAEKRRDQGPYVYSCLPANTLILTSDFGLRPIQDVKVGDMVVGLAKGDGNKRGGLVPSSVLAVQAREDEVFRYHLANGDYLDCTESHKWWVGRWRDVDSGNTYLPMCTDKRKPGHTSGAVKILDIPWGELSRKDWEAAAWLGGIFDGEGSVSGSLLTITQSRTVNPRVCDRIEHNLKRLKFDFGVYNRKDEKSGVVIYYLKGGRNEVFRFLLLTNPAKRSQIVDGLMYRGGRVGGKAADDESGKYGKIDAVRKESLGVMPVYNIQTFTGNYIADGYASSNCQMLLSPVTKKDQRFRPEWLRYYRTLPTPLSLYLICDPANEKKKKLTGGDFTVYWLWGLDAYDNLFMVDCIRDRLTLTERWKALKEMRRKHPNIQRIGYEQYGMAADIQHYEEMMLIEGVYFNILELGGNKLSKEDRVARIIPLFEQGRVHLPERLLFTDKEGKEVDLVQVFVNEEYLRFPFSQHDDMLDAASRIEDKALEANKPSEDWLDDEESVGYGLHGYFSGQAGGHDMGRCPITGY